MCEKSESRQTSIRHTFLLGAYASRLQMVVFGTQMCNSWLAACRCTEVLVVSAVTAAVITVTCPRYTCPVCQHAASALFWKWRRWCHCWAEILWFPSLPAVKDLNLCCDDNAQGKPKTVDEKLIFYGYELLPAIIWQNSGYKRVSFFISFY